MGLELLARKAWTRHELRQRLCRRGAPAEVAEALVADFEGRGYLDDRAFAATWAESRARGRAAGSHRLREELVRKGIARPLVEEAVRRAFEETDELTRARAAAARRWPLLQAAASRRRAGDRGGPDPAARRLQDYLTRRGYPPAVVRRVIREMSPGLVDETPDGS